MLVFDVCVRFLFLAVLWWLNLAGVPAPHLEYKRQRQGKGGIQKGRMTKSYGTLRRELSDLETSFWPEFGQSHYQPRLPTYATNLRHPPMTTHDNPLIKGRIIVQLAGKAVS